MVSMLGVSSCEDRLDSPRPSTGVGKTVEVSLCVGIADEVDAASLNAGSSGTKSVGARNNGAFDVRLVPAAVRTKADALASAKPDQLQNLQILQYDSNRNFKKLTPTVSQATGSTLTVDLVACENCQLIIVARGSSNAISEFSGSPSWSDLQGRLANAATINGIVDDDINAMPYFIHLTDVRVTNEGKIIIQSADGSDARILLKRLAVRLTVNWKFAEGLRTDYTLKEVKLCQVPTVYYLLPQTETDSLFEGALYPSSLLEYRDLYRLKGTDAKNEGSLVTWMPANAKGRSRSVTSEYYRTKEYAHASATYMEFVVDSKDGSERMYYRAYLGGKDVSDFNLLENTNYNYTINIRNTDYRGDPRIRLLDQTPVISTNLVQTSNCFMMRPGTNIGDRANALVHVKVPVTQGGNAVITAYASDGTTILWSWHVWVTDYVPVPLSGDITSSNRESAIKTARNATAGGTVHTYRGTSWTQENGVFFKKVIMDRNLGAIRSTFSTDDDLDAARAYGNLYQWGRKDPLPGSADGTSKEVGIIYDGDGVALPKIKVLSGGNLENCVKNPLVFYSRMVLDDNSWGPVAKTIYDPCPKGWKVPDFHTVNSVNDMFQGFGYGASNLMIYFKGTWYSSGLSSQNDNGSRNGFLYMYPGESAPNSFTDKSVWFPSTRLRELAGGLRTSNPSMTMYSAHGAGKTGWYTEIKAFQLHITNSANADKGYGMSVRCVQAN